MECSSGEDPETQQKVVAPEDLSFETLCNFFDVMVKYGRNVFMKKKAVSCFIETCLDRKSDNVFQVFRLIVPKLDDTRPSYGLDEYKLIYEIALVTDLIDDHGLMESLYRWTEKDPVSVAMGEPRELSRLLEDKVFEKYCGVKGSSGFCKDLKVKDVNRKLDELCKMAGNIQKQAKIIKWFLQRTTARQMKWLVQILLRHVKIYTSDRLILESWHELAPDLLALRGASLKNTLSCLRYEDACEDVDLKPSCPLRPQTAMLLLDTQSVMHKMHYRGGHGRMRKSFLAEANFDGVRLQVHKNGDLIQYFAFEGAASMEVNYQIFNKVIQDATCHDDETFILDGKIAVWNSNKKIFENKEKLNAVLGGICEADALTDLTRESLLGLELTYIVFDVLYHEISTIGFTLLERLNILESKVHCSEQVVAPIKIRLIPLLPGVASINNVCMSQEVSSIDELEEFMQNVHRLRTKGVIVKVLESTYDSMDRSSWINVKPNFVRKLCIHCIIMGFWSSDACSVSNWLLGIRSGIDFVPCCVVENTLDNNETLYIQRTLDAQIALPGPCFDRRFLVKNRMPDSIVRDPSKSAVISISAEISCPSHDLQDLEVIDTSMIGVYRISPACSTSFQQIFEACTRKKSQTDNFLLGNTDKDRTMRIPERFKPCDTSKIDATSTILKEKMIYFINHPATVSGKFEDEKLVKLLGGQVAQNYCPQVTYVLADHQDSITKCFSKQNIDVVSTDWMHDLFKIGGEGPPIVFPKYFLPVSPEKAGDSGGPGPNFSSSPVKKVINTSTKVRKDTPVKIDTSPTKKHKFLPAAAAQQDTGAPHAGREFAGNYVFVFLDCEKIGIQESNLQAREKVINSAIAHGAIVEAEITQRTTHIVLFDCPPACTTDQILDYVWMQQGKERGIRNLKDKVEEETIVLVRSQWLDECLKSFASSSLMQVPTLDSCIPSCIPYIPVDMDSCWPWEKYLQGRIRVPERREERELQVHSENTCHLSKAEESEITKGKEEPSIPSQASPGTKSGLSLKDRAKLLGLEDVEEKTPVGKGLALDVSKDESLDDLSTPSPQLELKGKKAVETPDTTTETSLSLQAREAEEHALVAAAKQREVEKHHAELISLRKQAEDLEQQSKALLDEAEAERAKVKLALEAAESAEKQEEKGYASAEAVEKERREAAQIALPKLESAADAEVYAQEVTQQAEDHEFHAQILENRAKALVQESEQMSELASEKQQEANEVAAKIDGAVKELEELELKADDGKPGDLPEYVMECEREVGMLQRRLAQLTEEIAWSKREIERRRKDGELWNRLLTKRRAALADLKMEHYNIEQAIVDAKERANIAAQEATMPAGLAEEKFSLAAELRKQATEATNKALEIQREAIEAARRAMEIQKQRELAMADAAKAEAEARQAEKDAATIQAAIAEREIAANQKMQDAASLKRKAEDTMAMKDEINKIHALSQLHPMYFTGEELIETAPPAPKTPASTSLST